MFAKKTEKHAKTYEALPSGAGKIVCSCGWESPAVDEGSAFTLGRRVKTPDAFYAEHLSEQTVETQMIDRAEEKAVTPAHKPGPRREKRA